MHKIILLFFGIEWMGMGWVWGGYGLGMEKWVTHGYLRTRWVWGWVSLFLLDWISGRVWV